MYTSRIIVWSKHQNYWNLLEINYKNTVLLHNIHKRREILNNSCEKMNGNQSNTKVRDISDCIINLESKTIKEGWTQVPVPQLRFTTAESGGKQTLMKGWMWSHELHPESSSSLGFGH
jgi:hypothetical protein